MTEEIRRIVGKLEGPEQTAQLAAELGLSEADVQVIRGTPLWQLRESLVNGRTEPTNS